MNVCFNTYHGGEVRIDFEAGVITGVVLANEGVNRNGYFFSERFLRELMVYGNERGEIKCRFEHPSFEGVNALGSLVGVYRNFRLDGGRLLGDLYISDLARRTEVSGRGISIADYVLGMASKHADLFGNSISVLADCVDESYVVEGKTYMGVGLKLIEWLASDLVDDPAATNGLFFSSKRFNNRYMGILDKVKKALAFALVRAFALDLTLANGNVITVETEGERPAVGDKVRMKQEDGKDSSDPLADGEYLLKDETTLVVEGGEIKEIKEREDDTQTEGVNEEFAREVLSCFEAVAAKMEAMNVELSKLKSVQSKFSVSDPKGFSNEPQGGKGIDLSAVRAKLGRE